MPNACVPPERVQVPEYIETVSKVLAGLTASVSAYDSPDVATYDREGVVAYLETAKTMLEEAGERLSKTLCFTRPKHLPKTIPWCGRPFDSTEEVDPFVYDGTMSPEDFDLMQERRKRDSLAERAAQARAESDRLNRERRSGENREDGR